MLVFVDESGDPGMKLGLGSSEFFVLTLVIFENNEEAIRTDGTFVSTSLAARRRPIQ